MCDLHEKGRKIKKGELMPKRIKLTTDDMNIILSLLVLKQVGKSKGRLKKVA